MTAALLLSAVCLSEPPPAVAALEQQVKSAVAKADGAVLAVVVSHDPRHGDPDPNKPWVLGEYARGFDAPAGGFRFGRGFRGGEPDRDRLDLADVRNAADYTFGSGIVLDPKAGLVLTSFHLIDGARKIYVRGPGGGWYANLHAGDARADLAVLKLIPREDRPFNRLKALPVAAVRTHDDPEAGPATLARGQFVLTIGHPHAAGFQDGRPSVGWGMISNLRQRGPNPFTEEQRVTYLSHYASLIQVDARLALGSSGGALLNLDGELIALTTSTAALVGSEAAGGYAVPFDSIYRGIVEVLKQGREVEYGFLGVTRKTPEPGDGPGLVVENVSSFSPAMAAGLIPGDVLRAVNGRPIRDMDDLFLLVGGALAGNKIRLDVARGGGRTINVEPTLAKFVHPHKWVASVRPPSVHGLRIDWSSIFGQQIFGPGVRQPNLNGVAVRELEPGSRAAVAFKTAGVAAGQSLITHVNGVEVRTPAKFYEVVGRSDKLTLSVIGLADGGDKSINLP